MNLKKRLTSISLCIAILFSTLCFGINVHAATPYTKGQAIVNYAKTFKGIPYSWGAIGPNSFDCSGFVQYVYKHFGIDLPHYTIDQLAYGTVVSKSALQP